MTEPRLLTRRAAAAYCGVSPGTFDRLVAAGVFPRRVEPLKRFDLKAIDAAIDIASGRPVDAAPPGVKEDFWTKRRRERAARKN